jgi:putative ABC transport system ATP-binding protein
MSSKPKKGGEATGEAGGGGGSATTGGPPGSASAATTTTAGASTTAPGTTTPKMATTSDGRPIVVQAVDLAKRYKRGRIAVAALDGVTITIARGEIIGIVGPSGSGKTTLLNLIGGLDRPTHGKVVVNGINLGELGDSDLADYRLKTIGFIFQFYNLISTLNALENIELPMGLAKVPRDERGRRARELLEVVGLSLRVNHMPEELSGGEQQRVAVARALSNNPSVILGDEPTGDLDSRSAKALMDLLWALRKEKKVTFVLVTHDPIVVARCDRVYSIRDGKVLREIVPKSGDVKRISDEERAAMETLY